MHSLAPLSYVPLEVGLSAWASALPAEDSNLELPGSEPGVSTNSTNRDCREPALLPPPQGASGLVFTTELSRTDRDRPCAYLLKSDQVGCVGLNSNFILASAKVLSPLYWLQGSHAATVLVHVFLPPREVGTMWSTVLPQSAPQ